MDNVLFSRTERREEKKARREEGREKEGSKLSPFYTNSEDSRAPDLNLGLPSKEPQCLPPGSHVHTKGGLGRALARLNYL